MQYTLNCDIYGNKMTFFIRQVEALFFFLLKQRLWALIRTVPLSTHNLCFRTEKIPTTPVDPCNPQVYHLKVGVGGASYMSYTLT